MKLQVVHRGKYVHTQWQQPWVTNEEIPEKPTQFVFSTLMKNIAILVICYQNVAQRVQIGK